mmetsp:Transcript_74654/g.196770  ORF Transcript_74654/g.196770 Transcript_74654/m.196770 type:complete len:222 (+) Transcript_74654:321-986(+)
MHELDVGPARRSVNTDAGPEAAVKLDALEAVDKHSLPDKRRKVARGPDPDTAGAKGRQVIFIVVRLGSAGRPDGEARRDHREHAVQQVRILRVRYGKPGAPRSGRRHLSTPESTHSTRQLELSTEGHKPVVQQGEVSLPRRVDDEDALAEGLGAAANRIAQGKKEGVGELLQVVVGDGIGKQRRNRGQHLLLDNVHKLWESLAEVLENVFARAREGRISTQ